MNRIFKLAFLLFIALSTGKLHAEPDDGFPRVRLVNATGLSGKIQIFIKGENVNPDGYESGMATAAFSLYPEEVEIKIQHPLIDDTVHQMKLLPSDRIAIIVYSEPKKGKELGVSTKRAVKFTTLQGKERGSKKTATLLFLSVSEGLELSMNQKMVNLTPHKQLDMVFGDARSSQVNLAVKDKTLRTFDIDEPGDYAVIVYDKPDGTQGCVTFNNSKR